MRSRTLVAAGAVASLAALTACSSTGGTEGTPEEGGGDANALVVARANDVTTLDQDAAAASQEAWETLQLIAEPLFGIDAAGDLVPRVAEEYEFSEDNSRLTITLRDGVTFNDGTPVTAEDVRFTIENAQQGELQGGLYAPITEIETPDESTVVLTYAAPNSGAVLDLAGYAVAVIPADFGGQEEETFWQDPVAVGPFELESWEQGVEMTLVPNEEYYGEQPQVDELTFVTVPDENTRLLQLQNGTADLVASVSPAQVAQVESGAGQIVEFPSGQNYFLTLNSTIPPFDDEHARRAVSLAIDRQSVVDAALQGYGRPGGSFVVPTALGGYSPEFGLRTDVAAAQEELARSATPDGFEFTITYVGGSPEVETAMQVVQQNLAEIGVTVTLEGLEPTAIQDRIASNEWNAYVANIVADTDAGSVLQYYGATNGFYSGDAEMIAAMEEAFAEANADFSGQEARDEIFQVAATRISESALQIAVYDTSRLWAVADDVQGVVAATPTGAVDFTQVTVE